MKVLLSFSVVPMGVGASVAEYVAACEEVLVESGLSYEMHANGTDVEGEWDAVFATIRRCHERLHELGVPRLATTIFAGTRADKDQTLAQKLDSVRRRRKG
jgi:uncharacterized protein (TIGR00106 family)